MPQPLSRDRRRRALREQGIDVDPGVLPGHDRRRPRPGRADRRAGRRDRARAGVLPRDLPHLAVGDVVPVQGGLEAGLPDITVWPDLATITPLPWEPNAAWCLGDATTAGRRAPRRSRRARSPPRSRTRLRQLGYSLMCGPELEFFLCEQGPDGTGAGTPTSSATSTWSAARATRRAAAAHAAPAAGRRAAGDRREPRVLAGPVRDQPRRTPTCSTPPTARSGSSPRCRRSPACRGCWPHSWPSRSTTRAGPDSTCTSRWPTTPAGTSSATPRAQTGCRRSRGTRSPACCGTRPR